MRGHIAKKGKRYYAVVYEGVDPATGKERHRWHAGGSRRSDAEKLLTELVKRAHDGHTTPSERVALGGYLTEKWLPIQRAQLRPSTFDSYRRNIENHVVPALGRIPLHKLDTRGPRHLLRPAADRREAQRRWRRPQPEDGPVHPPDHPQGVEGRVAEGFGRPQRRRGR